MPSHKLAYPTELSYKSCDNLATSLPLSGSAPQPFGIPLSRCWIVGVLRYLHVISDLHYNFNKEGDPVPISMPFYWTYFAGWAKLRGVEYGIRVGSRACPLLAVPVGLKPQALKLIPLSPPMASPPNTLGWTNLGCLFHPLKVPTFLILPLAPHP